jgi:leader peptidase (prepilin peptidase)/N-methyltransferase
MLDIPAAGAALILGLFGLLFGSFANVVIWRVPRGESVSSPGSHCPRCDTPIAWYDNIPVVSWLVLRARCRHCGEPISWRYPAVESAMGAAFAVAGWTFGLSVRGLLACVLLFMLLTLSLIDLDTRRLPNVLVAILAAAGLIGAVLAQVTAVPAAPLIGQADAGLLAQPLVAALLGALLGAGLSFAIALVYALARGRQGLGMGDVKLLGALGLFLGPYVLLAYLLGNVLGVGGILVGRPRTHDAAPRDGGDSVDAFFEAESTEAAHPEAASAPSDTDELLEPGSEPEPGEGEGEPAPPASIPFGPFLAAGAVIALFFGPALAGAYLRLVGLA